MADVDLSVGVTTTGVQSATSMLTAYAQAVDKASAASRRATAEVERAAQLNARAAGSYERAAKSVQDMTTALERQQRAYSASSAMRVGATPAERLIGAYGSMRKATTAISLMQQQIDALNADPFRDLIAVQKEEQKVAEARGRLVSAQSKMAQAAWERELAAMTPVAAAQQRLTRATQELATATRVSNAANRRNDGTLQTIEAQIAATNRLTAAQRGYAEAKRQVARAEEEAARAAQKAAEQAHREKYGLDNDNAFQSSYSYFILAGLATGAATAIFGVGTASITASKEVERSFADVERTFDGTNQQLESLRSTLFELSTASPISVTDLAEIATLGNQLGVAAEDIEAFTQTIAQYTAVSGQSAEDAATAFGRISNLTGLAASEYDRLASAITYTARTTVATESTIQNTAKEITALASGAGFSADAIVGLAGALSSLAIPPERARGALSLYFGALNSAVAEGGPKLAAFADLTNLTAAQLGKMVRENRGQEVFTAFIQGLSELDTVAKTTSLDTLGLSTIRVDQTMRALSQNVPLVTSSFEGANRAFEENVEIANQYAIIQETLDSKWKEFQNSIQNASATLGDQFAPAAKEVLSLATDMIVAFTSLGDSPLGRGLLNTVLVVTSVVGALAALVGVLALAKASMVVLTFAIRQLGWEQATSGLKMWAANLTIADAQQRKSAMSALTFSAALKQTTGSLAAAATGARVLSGALTVLKFVGPILAITALFTAIESIATAADKAINPSKRLSDDLTGLKDALILDNPNAVPEAVEEVGRASTSATAGLSAFNQSILTAIQVQKQAEGALAGTNEQIDAQAFKLGDASRAWIADALKSQEDIKDIIDGRGFWEEVWEDFTGAGTPLGIFDGWRMGGDELISRDQFEELILGGLDINALAQIAATQGQDAAMVAYDKFREGFEKENPDSVAAARFEEALPSILDSVVDAYGKAAVEAALAGNAIEQSGAVAVAAAADYDEFGNYIGDAIEKGEALQVTFSGVTSRLDDFRDAIQGAIKGHVAFDEVMKRAEDTAQAAIDTYNELHGTDLSPAKVDAAGFGAALQAQTDEAVAFYDGLMQLAAGGSQSFALQLAELGPEAQSVLSSALNMDASSQQQLEAAARFAAFLASDAFKNELEAQMTDSNQAYALIFKATGDLSQVQSYIAAQVAGTGAEWEKQWAINNPDLPLNVTPTLVNPTPEDVALYAQQLSGRITVTPKIAYSPTGQEYVSGNVYTDNQTGAQITLPASLDGSALSASLAVWQQDQSASPEELAATLNQDGLSESLTAWRKAYGPVRISAIVVPNTSYFNGSLFSASGNNPERRNGGIISDSDAPRFANGGGYGMFQGPGGGRSDSIWARVSAGEFISTAAATKFWGPDFFDALNRKMLPASFANMLGAVAASGNQGPQSVTNVNVTQVNPVTRDPLKQLREDSEKVAAGIW